MQRGTPHDEAVDQYNNQPHIVRFVDATGDIPPLYFIAMEQQLMIECRDIESTIFILLAVHFVFNMEYNPKVKDIMYFFQDKVLNCADSAFKKSSMYLCISSAIDLYLTWYTLYI